jgi:ABC-type nitrate/sulfonate/bicarbonate transport system ATPase subunit
MAFREVRVFEVREVLRLWLAGVGLSVESDQPLRRPDADAPILLLDEPTSALDAATEADFLNSLEELMAGRTVAIHHEELVNRARRVHCGAATAPADERECRADSDEPRAR